MILKVASGLSRLAGKIVMTIFGFVTYLRRDVFQDLLDRPKKYWHLEDLLLPALLLVLAIYLLRKKKKTQDEKTTN